MPRLYYAVSVLLCKFLCSRKIANLEAMRFTQFHPVLNIKNCFRASFPNMDMYRSVIVAVKSEFETVFLKNNRHGRSVG